jgi:ribosomal protein S18 acetylase RimI-like enzyme
LIELRQLSWPEDRASLLALDTSFVTDRVYSLKQNFHSFTLEETSVAPPVQKSYRLESELDALPHFDWVQVAGDGGVVIGVIAMRLEHWNRRANLHHLYLAPGARRKGIGRLMIEAALQEASAREMRSLWAETQTVNYAAVRFYESMGFTLCGLDTSLYDPGTVNGGEIALFFSRPVI